jgi:hypothetical protein
MNDFTRTLANKRIEEYDLRLRHLDGLFKQAGEKLKRNPEQTEASLQLEKLKCDRDKLAALLDETKSKPLANWREEEILRDGPMAIWDVVAQQLENLVESFERKAG